MRRRCFDLGLLAVYAARKLQALAPDEAFVLLDRAELLAPRDANIRKVRGDLQLNLRRWQQAIASSRSALELAADSERMHLFIAQIQQKNGLAPEAQLTLESGLQERPGSAALLASLASLQLQQGDRPAARRLVDRVLEVAPRHEQANLTLGRLLFESSDPVAAIPQLERVRQLSPADFSSRMALAQYYLTQDLFAEAKSVLIEALNIDPAHREANRFLASAHLGMANHLARQGDHHGALQAYDEAIMREPQFMPAYANKAQLLGAIGRHEEAKALLQTFLDDTEDRSVRILLGDMHALSGAPAAGPVSLDQGLAGGDFSGKPGD